MSKSPKGWERRNARRAEKRRERRLTRKRNAEAAARIRLVADAEADRLRDDDPGAPSDELMEFERLMAERWAAVERDALAAEGLFQSLVRELAAECEAEGLRGDDAKLFLMAGVMGAWPASLDTELWTLIGLIPGGRGGDFEVLREFEDWSCVRVFYWRFGCRFEWAGRIRGRND